MSEINVKFPDGAVKQFAAGTTTQDIAKSISISLAKKSVAGEFNGKLVDYNEPLNEDGEIKIITKDSDEGMNVLWQTAANILASALHSLYPEMKFGQGEALEHGFFFDTDNVAGQVAEADFEKIEQKMQEIIKQNLPIERVEYTEEEALQLVVGDQYQTELVINWVISMTSHLDHNWLQLVRSKCSNYFQWLGLTGKVLQATQCYNVSMGQLFTSKKTLMLNYNVEKKHVNVTTV